MSTQTTTAFSTLPRVNLLPPEIGERKRLQQVQMIVVLLVVTAVAGVGYAYVEGKHSVQSAQSALTKVTTENANLTRAVASYSNVKGTAAELAAHEAMLIQATSTEVRWSEYLSDFSQLPPNTWLTSLTLTDTLSPGSLLTPSQATPKIGTVTVQGIALKYGDLANWLDALQPEPGVANVSFSTATETYIGASKVIDFQGSSDLTSAALSGRCAKPGSC